MHCIVTTVNNTVLYTLKWASQVVLVVKNPPANMGDKTPHSICLLPSCIQAYPNRIGP